MSMVKLIYSDSFDKNVDVGMRIIEDPAQITKQASTIFGCDYSDLQPDKDHVGIHLVALGDSEHFGLNRNFDGFSKAACIKYHDTFVKHGHVFRHHRNRPERGDKILGNVKASAYNEDMGRIELFVHAHKDAARDELQKLAKDGETPHSMACRVPGDFCTRCGTFRKNASDPNQCEHIAEKLGELYDDGTVAGMDNRDPTFFDISFVGRPADRIAWSIKTAGAKEFIDSVKLAEASGIWVPDSVAIESAHALSKLELMRKLAGYEARYSQFANDVFGYHTHSGSNHSRYLWELRKAASSDLDDQTIEQLRRYRPEDLFESLVKIGAVLSPRSFFKYAFGCNYGDVSEHIPGALKATRTIMSELLKAGEAQRVCNDGMFDVAVRPNSAVAVPSQLLMKCAAECGLVGPARDERAIRKTIEQQNIKIAVDKLSSQEFNTDLAMVVLATKYAAYKLSALEAIMKSQDTDEESVLACSAAQDMIE